MDEAAPPPVTRGKGPLARDAVTLEAGNGQKQSSPEPRDGPALPLLGLAREARARTERE